LYFFPLPQGQGSFLPTFGTAPERDDAIAAATAPNNIEWTVVTDGYKFTVAGIHFQNPSQFPDNPGSTGGGKKWKVKDNYTEKGDFKYGVKVYRESDHVECKLNDPLISNQ
jgi:hypothetical protein